MQQKRVKFVDSCLERAAMQVFVEQLHLDLYFALVSSFNIRFFGDKRRKSSEFTAAQAAT